MPKTASDPSEERETSIRSLARGLELLNCFDEEHLTLSLTEFSHLTGLSVSTISRILQTLVKMGYLNREIDRKYTLGNQVFRLVRILSNSSNLRATARPILEAICLPSRSPDATPNRWRWRGAEWAAHHAL